MAGLGEHFLVWFDKLELKLFGPTTKLAEKVCASSLKTGVHFSYKSDVEDVLTKVKEKMKESLKLMPVSRYVYRCHTEFDKVRVQDL